MNSDMPDAILMVADALTNLNRKRVFEFAAAKKLPAIYEYDFIVRDGGLMSYGPDLTESFERAAALIARILEGAKPADLPFEQPTLYPFALNLKTAKSTGIEIPPTLLALADEESSETCFRNWGTFRTCRPTLRMSDCRVTSEVAGPRSCRTFRSR
jgi:putative ABC transport system substrate-binding protein